MQGNFKAIHRLISFRKEMHTGLERLRKEHCVNYLLREQSSVLLSERMCGIYY